MLIAIFFYEEKRKANAVAILNLQFNSANMAVKDEFLFENAFYDGLLCDRSNIFKNI